MNCKAKLSSWRCKTVQPTLEDCIAVHAASAHQANNTGHTADEKEVKIKQNTANILTLTSCPNYITLSVYLICGMITCWAWSKNDITYFPI